MMGKIGSLAAIVCVLLVANAWGAGFMDDFNRSDGVIGNGWTTQTNGTIKVEIVDNEVLVAGTQATDWARCGIYRAVKDETRISFDFKADNSFNVHIRVDSADSAAFVEVYAWPGGPFSYASSADGSWPGWTQIAGSNMLAGEYNTLVLEQDDTEFTVTLNGKVIGTITNAGFTSIERVLLSSDAAAGTTGSLHLDNVQIGEVVAGAAKEPSPAQNATDVPSDVALGWIAGAYAATHDVYFGTAFADVNDASRADPKGVLVSQGQTAAEYDQDSALEFGRTYYWRIDEVNAAPDNTIFKGDVWSFTVEPFEYVITGVTATASSAQPGMGPQNAVNGAGLNSLDQHATEPTQMWMSAGTKPNWIQFELDKVYKLYEMLVWNSNQLIEGFVGFGAKDVTIEYSADGATWSVLEDAPQFAQAPGAAGYTANTTVDLAGVMAKYVKVTINSNWGGVAPQTGLAEVRFSYIPVAAREPQPAVGATGVGIDTELNWRPGREAESHEVYLGTDQNAMTLAGTPAEHSYTPVSLEFGTTYYWRVDEIGGGGPYPGPVWSFATQEYAAIDDFEAYTDDIDAQATIWHAWIDGLTTGVTGSQVGYDVAPFAEKKIVHGGAQSMPLQYDNAASPFLSEAERTFAPAENWTTNGADSLVVYFRGEAPGFVQLASGNIIMSAIGADIWGNADEFRYAYKTLNGDGTMVARVESIAQSDVWAKGGVMIRQSVEPGSVHAFMPITASGGNGASFQRRMTAGGASSNDDSTTAVKAPYWVMIQRKGNAFSGYISPDGTTWTQLGAAQTIPMTGPVLIGLALCSHNAAVTTGAEFSNISTTGNVTGAWQVAEIGVSQPTGNSIEGIYLSVKDTSGKTKVIQHPDASATARTSWQEWKIPLSDFTSAGVKMNAVKSMVIGVGVKAAPKAGGTGIVYVDDIAFGRSAATP